MEKALSLIDISFLQKLKNYFALAKPKIVYLVLFTAFASMVLAVEDLMNFNAFTAIAALFCIALGAGGAGAINMWYDRDIDAIMERTKLRPIPSGKIEGANALFFGLFLSISSVLLMYLAVNCISALLLACAIFYYAVIYTMWLKRSTSQNIVIGGGAGAFPPLVGWAAMTNSISMEGMILFAIIFLWTPPHFWALSLKSCDDYTKAKIPMLPLVVGVKITKTHIVLYSFALGLVALCPYFFGFCGVLYLVAAFLLSTNFIYHAIAVYKDTEKCMNLFYFSIIYLFTLFIIMIVDKFLAGLF